LKTPVNAGKKKTIGKSDKESKKRWVTTQNKKGGKKKRRLASAQVKREREPSERQLGGGSTVQPNESDKNEKN